MIDGPVLNTGSSLCIPEPKSTIEKKCDGTWGNVRPVTLGALWNPILLRTSPLIASKFLDLISSLILQEPQPGYWSALEKLSSCSSWFGFRRSIPFDRLELSWWCFSDVIGVIKSIKNSVATFESKHQSIFNLLNRVLGRTARFLFGNIFSRRQTSPDHHSETLYHNKWRQSQNAFIGSYHEGIFSQKSPKEFITDSRSLKIPEPATILKLSPKFGNVPLSVTYVWSAHGARSEKSGGFFADLPVLLSQKRARVCL